MALREKSGEWSTTKLLEVCPEPKPPLMCTHEKCYICDSPRLAFRDAQKIYLSNVCS